MGLDISLYLGPYVECVYKDGSHEIDVWGCTNTECDAYKKRDKYGRPTAKFCSVCASPIGKSKRAEKYRPSPYDVLGEREKLTQLGSTIGDRMWFGSNIKGPRSFNVHTDDCHLNLTDHSAFNPEEEMRWLYLVLREDIDRLRAAYTDVEIKWGLHVYWM